MIPINRNETHDKALINILQNIIKSFLKTSMSARSRYQGDRVNEVERRIEEVLEVTQFNMQKFYPPHQLYWHLVEMTIN